MCPSVMHNMKITIVWDISTEIYLGGGGGKMLPLVFTKYPGISISGYFELPYAGNVTEHSFAIILNLKRQCRGKHNFGEGNFTTFYRRLSKSFVYTPENS